MTRIADNSAEQPGDESRLSSNESDQHPLDQIAEEFAARCRAGEKVTINQYVRQYPQWADELRNVLSSIALMEKLKAHDSSGSHARTHPLPPPQRLGDFRIIREVGRGGMGVVYEAFEQSLGRHVAIKILSASALIDPRQLQRFHREAQAAGRLHHTNIVPVFGAGEVDGIHFYVMQFISGQALNQILTQLSTESKHPSAMNASAVAPSLPSEAELDRAAVPYGKAYWRWVADVGYQVAGALDYAHQQGTLHRDVKPANLLLDARGTVWITDFGLAKLAGPRDVTQSGDVIGTLQYLAPEALHGHADARRDLYSLGLTLYELLTLKAPIQGDTPAATLRAVEHLTPIAPRRIVPEIPRDLETIVLKAIARDPRLRYISAAALAADLDNFLHDRPIAARRSSSLERLWRWCRRNRALSSAIGAAIAATLLALIVGWTGYVKTRDALLAEAQRRIQADRATARAEQNMQLSLHAFEDIFNQVDQQQGVVLDPPPPEGPPDRAEKNDRRPRNGAVDANILRSILTFYDKFAQENPTNSALDAEAARAYQRIGDLYFRMDDQSVAAGQAYARAATMYDHLRHTQSEHDANALLGYADAVSSMSMDIESLGAQRDRLLTLIEKLDATSPASNASLQRRASAQVRLGNISAAMNDPTAAQQAYQQALDTWRHLPPVRPPGPPIATPQAPDAALALSKLLVKQN